MLQNGLMSLSLLRDEGVPKTTARMDLHVSLDRGLPSLPFSGGHVYVPLNVPAVPVAAGQAPEHPDPVSMCDVKNGLCATRSYTRSLQSATRTRHLIRFHRKSLEVQFDYILTSWSKGCSLSVPLKTILFIVFDSQGK